MCVSDGRETLEEGEGGRQQQEEEERLGMAVGLHLVDREV